MNPLPTDPLDLTILLYKNLQDRNVYKGQITGRVNQAENFDALCTALEQAHLLISKSAADRTIECHTDKGFFLSLTDLLIAPARRLKPPAKFYLADGDALFTGDETALSQEGRDYLATTRFHALLETVSDYHWGVGADKTLVFLHKEKIELTSEYTVADLHALPELDAFSAEFIASNTHQEQKRTILKTVLLELFSGRTKLRFSELLARFDDFVDKIRASYQLYVAEFSFQKVKAEVEKEKLDAMIKLNKVFSDVQGQLLTVPVALVLVGGQMKNVGSFTFENLMIWLGALVFSVLMNLLIRNQRHTLNAVKHEIDQQRQQIESKYQTIAPRFVDIYKEIEERHAHQHRLILVIDALVAISLFISTVLLFFFSGFLPCVF